MYVHTKVQSICWSPQSMLCFYKSYYHQNKLECTSGLMQHVIFKLRLSNKCSRVKAQYLPPKCNGVEVLGSKKSKYTKAEIKEHTFKSNKVPFICFTWEEVTWVVKIMYRCTNVQLLRWMFLTLKYRLIQLLSSLWLVSFRPHDLIHCTRVKLAAILQLSQYCTFDGDSISTVITEPGQPVKSSSSVPGRRSIRHPHHNISALGQEVQQQQSFSFASLRLVCWYLIQNELHQKQLFP